MWKNLAYTPLMRQLIDCSLQTAFKTLNKTLKLKIYIQVHQEKHLSTKLNDDLIYARSIEMLMCC